MENEPTITITLPVRQWIAIGDALTASEPILLELPDETKAPLADAVEALGAELHRFAGTKGKGSIH